MLFIYAAFVVALTLIARLVRPRSNRASVIALATLFAPIAMVLLAASLAVSTYLDTRPWTDFDKAEGYAAAIWYLIFSAIALGVGLPAAWLASIAHEAILRRKPPTSEPS